jgi:hypothetical protein
MKLLSGNMIRKSDPLEAPKAPIVKHLQAMKLMFADGPGLTRIQQGVDHQGVV